MNTLVPDSGLIGAAGSAGAAASFTKQLPTYQFDLNKAKSELAESKHADGFAVTVPYMNTNQWQRLLALNLQQNMKKIGVTVTPKPVPPGQWFKDIFSHQATGIQLLAGFTSPLFDPSGLMSSFVGKANMKPNALNTANFTTATIEKNYPLVAPETSAKYPQAQRWKATKAILTETAEQVPYVPLFTEQEIYAAGNGVAFTRAPQTVELGSGAWIDLVRSTK